MKTSRFKTSGQNLSGNYKNLPFSEYLTQMKHIIAQNTAAAYQNDTIIDLNSPFCWVPENPCGKGVLLIHSLLDTPFMMRDLGEYFLKKGFLVKSILLPGHGTTPADFLEIRYQAWINAVRYGVDSFQNEVDSLTLCGASTGALLAIHEALQTDKVDSLVLISPANHIKSKFVTIANIHRLISWAIPRAAWLTIQPENDYAKYQSFALNAAHEVYKLGRLVKKINRQKQLKTPIFMVLSEDDETISAKAALAFFEKNPHDKNHLVLYTNKSHEPNPQIEIVHAENQDEKIKSLSHLGLTISPNNAHYGKTGDYTLQQKRTATSPSFGAVSNLQLRWQRLAKKCGLRTSELYRLYYNPYFDRLLESLDEFV